MHVILYRLDRIKKQHAATQRKETPDDQPVQVPNGPEPAVDQRRVGDGSTESESLFLMMMAYLKVSAYQANTRLYVFYY